MKREDTSGIFQLLAVLKSSLSCVVYFRNAPISGRKNFVVSIYGSATSPEIYVEVTDENYTRVKSFTSRHKHYTQEARQQELPLVDIADAFESARALTRKWPRPPTPEIISRYSSPRS